MRINENLIVRSTATRTVTLSTLTAWGQEVKIWDFDWRVE